MTKFIIKIDQKGWFKAFGLHHASISLIPCLVGYFAASMGFVTMGTFIASGGFWWYASREYGNGVMPPASFEIMDFTSPSIVAITGATIINYLFT